MYLIKVLQKKKGVLRLCSFIPHESTILINTHMESFKVSEQGKSDHVCV